MIFVDEANVLFVDADDAVDDGVRARFEFVVVRLDGDRYSIVELRRVRELRGVWRDIARDFGSPPRGVTGPPDDDVTEPAVFDTGEGLSVVLPDTHPAACGYETMAAAPSRGRATREPAGRALVACLLAPWGLG